MWGTSRHDGETSAPGRSSSGAALTIEQRIRSRAREYYRRAWDAAADTDDMAKDARRDQLGGRRADPDVEQRLLTISPMMGLTLHEQSQSPLQITQLDITTTESIVRAMSIAGSFSEAVPALPSGSYTSEDEIVDAGVTAVIDRAMARYGGLLDDPAQDRRLSRWLDRNYKRVYP